MIVPRDNLSESGWVCEKHPETAWPHEGCSGPGTFVFPQHEHHYDERGFCATCRKTRVEVAARGDLREHEMEGLRITMRCDAGHEETFEVAAFAPLIPVYCPNCAWHTLWRQVGQSEEFTMKISNSSEESLVCPYHGEVEGFLPMDGPLSNAVPTPILCEECDPLVETIIGYED